MRPPRTNSALRTAGLVARHDLRIALQGGRNVFFLVGVPLLMIVLVGLGARGFADRMQLEVRIDVADLDATEASRAFVAGLAAANEAFAVRAAPSPDSRPEGPSGGAAAHASLTIPKGFAAALEKGETTILTFRPGAGLAAPAIAFAAAQTVATRLGGPYAAARLSSDFAAAHGVEAGPEFRAGRLAAARDDWSRPTVLVESATTAPNEKMIYGAQLMENGFKLSVPSLTAIFVMISVLGLMQSLAEERSAGLLRRVGTMPVTNARFLGGKLAAAFLLGWAQFVALIVFGEALGVGQGSAPLAAAVAAAYALAVTALALALSAVARTPGQASAVATTAWIVLTMLGGAWWPLVFVPPWMRTLGHLSPVAWCLDALNALILGRGSAPDVLLPSAVLVLFAAVLFLVGVRALDLHSAGAGRARTPALFGIRTLDAE
jgi:ABC-2 type transport system permease protein